MTQGKEGVPRAYMNNIRWGILRHGKVLGYRLAPNSCPELGLGCRKHVPSDFCRVEKKSQCQVIAYVTFSLSRLQIERGECSFVSKVIRAQEAGAAAVVVADLDGDNDEFFISMVDDTTKRKAEIPAGFLLGKNGWDINAMKTSKSRLGASYHLMPLGCCCNRTQSTCVGSSRVLRGISG